MICVKGGDRHLTEHLAWSARASRLLTLKLFFLWG